MLQLEHGTPDLRALVEISPLDGGRVASLRLGEEEMLVTGTSTDDPMQWGSYPMVPWAGRIRHGEITFDGREVQLPVNLPPHAIHGTGFVSRWEVLDQGLDHAELDCALDWPFGGRAHQHIQLTEQALVCVLSVVAGDRPMPATLGWHPWFRKPESDSIAFEAMYRQDHEGIPTGELVDAAPRPWDDCFVRPRGPLELRYRSGRVVTVSSDCDHWVVYDRPEHATCVEPQSAPPDGIRLGLAARLQPGELLQRTMTISWA